MNKRYVLITGAAGGIGKEISSMLAKEGYSLYLHYNKNKEGIEKLLANLQGIVPDGEFIPIQADLLTETGQTKLTQEIYQLFGIVHNSGISVTKPLTSMLPEEIQDLVTIHLTAPIMITKSLLPKMIKNQEGNIIFISSIWGQTGASCETVYSAVKGGQIAFAKALSKEMGPTQIRVNAIAPGAVETNMLNHLTDEEKQLMKEEIPLERFANPIDIANAVKFLLSDQSSYITGHVLNVNGGWYI